MNPGTETLFVMAPTGHTSGECDSADSARRGARHRCPDRVLPVGGQTGDMETAVGFARTRVSTGHGGGQGRVVRRLGCAEKSQQEGEHLGVTSVKNGFPQLLDWGTPTCHVPGSCRAERAEGCGSEAREWGAEGVPPARVCRPGSQGRRVQTPRSAPVPAGP